MLLFNNFSLILDYWQFFLLSSQHLFDRMLEHWKSGNKIQVLMVVGHLVRREPLWLQKIVVHQLIQLIIKSLKVFIYLSLHCVELSVYFQFSNRLFNYLNTHTQKVLDFKLNILCFNITVFEWFFIFNCQEYKYKCFATVSSHALNNL